MVLLAHRQHCNLNIQFGFGIYFLALIKHLKLKTGNNVILLHLRRLITIGLVYHHIDENSNLFNYIY